MTDIERLHSQVVDLAADVTRLHHALEKHLAVQRTLTGAAKTILYRVHFRTTGHWRVCVGFCTRDYANGYVAGRLHADSCPALRIVDESGEVIQKWRGHDRSKDDERK